VIIPVPDEAKAPFQEAEIQLIPEVETSDDDSKEPVPQPRASRNRDRVNYRELYSTRQYAKRGFALRASKAKLDNVPIVPSTVQEALNGPDKENCIDAADVDPVARA